MDSQCTIVPLYHLRFHYLCEGRKWGVLYVYYILYYNIIYNIRINQACSTIENRNGTMVHWYITFLYNLTFKINSK